MSITLPEELPADFAACAGLLDGIVARGLEKLLAEAKTKNYLEAPFGRKQAPTPLLSEEAFLTQGGLHGAGDDDEPAFSFEYGFNPLKFLAEYVRWSHPDSVKERRLERARCVQRLQFLAAHAKQQLLTSEGLRQQALAQGSGALWGPVCGVLSATSAYCVVQPLRHGTMLVDVSIDASFADADAAGTQNLKFDVAAASQEGHPLQPVCFDIKALRPNTRYYVRCYLAGANSLLPRKALAEGEAAAESKDGDMSAAPSPAPAAELFFSQSSSFWTVPLTGDETEEEEAAAAAAAGAAAGAVLEEESGFGLAPITLACLPAAFACSSTLPLSSVPAGCTVSCLLGDPFATDEASAGAGATSADPWQFHCKTQLMTSQDSVCRNSGLLLGWNDTSYGSAVDVQSEEVTFKQYEHDLRKYNKKHHPEKAKGANSGSKGHSSRSAHPPPVHTRPAISASLAALMHSLPVRVVEEGACRHVYTSSKLGPGVEVFCLDLRGGYMPKEQVKWLKDALQRSTAIWKIVLSGAPVAIAVNDGHRAKAATRQRNKKKMRAVDGEEHEHDTAEIVAASGEGGAVGGGGVRVSLQEPAKDERGDVDDLGRHKYGLPYMIASLQRAAERERQHLKQASVDESEAGAAMPEAVEAEATATAEAETKAETPVDDASVVRIDSGIVFVTSNATGSGLPRLPFVASFDPEDYGRKYCAEVSIGSAGVEEEEEEGAEVQHHVVQHMSTTFAFNSEAIHAPTAPAPAPDAAAASFSAVLRLEGDGDLTVRLLSLSGGAQLAQVRFKLNEESDVSAADDATAA